MTTAKDAEAYFKQAAPFETTDELFALCLAAADAASRKDPVDKFAFMTGWLLTALRFDGDQTQRVVDMLADP